MTARSAATARTTATAATAALLAHTAVNARLLRRAPCRRPAPRPVSVCIPARDEAGRIGQCVRAALASDWDDLEVVVLDDRSTDGTAGVARAAGAGDPRLRVVLGHPRPSGWLGKPWACAQLAAAARGAVLVFVDADVVLAPHGVAAAVALVDGGLDLACPYPRQVADGLLARLVQPLLQWSWLTFLPLRAAERSPRPSLTAANGQLLACTAATYARVGGHGAVRGEVLEDIALARAYKAAGLRAGVADGTDLADCTMYATSDDLVAGYTKSLWSAFGSPTAAAAAGALLWWLYVQPVADLAGALHGRNARDTGVATVRYVLGVAGRVVAARRTGGRPLDGLAHPASVGALLWLLARSVIGRRRGNLQWRDRPVALDGEAEPQQHAGSPDSAAPTPIRIPTGRPGVVQAAAGSAGATQQPRSPGGRPT